MSDLGPTQHDITPVAAQTTFDIWRDYPEDRYPTNTRRHHDCGCITVFDTEPWHSVVLRRCDEHTKGLDALWA